jgi:CRISPR-associated protein Cmr1
MKKLEHKVSFNTPAFLGNAEQNGQWRTPPFKALLRQWWRIRNAKQHNYNHHSMREQEGDLFGNAWLDPEDGQSRFRKSRVMLRLGSWDPGSISSQQWPGSGMESVVTTKDGKGRVRADLYLGYGPVLPAKKKENRDISLRGTAINTNASANMIFYGNEISDAISDVIQLMAWFGSVGSRSRNGWGSLHMDSLKDSPSLTALPISSNRIIQDILRPWEQCLDRDWSHAIGSISGKPLIWCTGPNKDWRKIMGCLAHIRVAVRTVAKKYCGPDRIGGIHLLGYPAGEKWEQSVLGKDARLGTQLRFKVVQTADGLVGCIAHFPCGFPEVLKHRLGLDQRKWLGQYEGQVWRAIHESLNRDDRLKALA